MCTQVLKLKAVIWYFHMVGFDFNTDSGSENQLKNYEINASSKIGWKSMREINSQLLIEAIKNTKYTFIVGAIFVEAGHKNEHFHYRDNDICHICLIKYTLYFSLFTSYSYVHYLDTIFNV